MTSRPQKWTVEEFDGPKKIIHVHQQLIKKGEPAVIVRTYAGSSHYNEVEILGPSKMIHSDTPDRCGARVWIETTSAVVGRVREDSKISS